MEYTTLGGTGMTVSRLCLGTVSFGSGSDWMLDEDESAEIIDHAIDRGINFFDTANAYSTGDSERIVGSTLDEYNRDRLVVATKAYFQMDENNPNSQGLSRKAIKQELENSLERLGMDTIDLYQIHRWDESTPIEETLRVLDDLVRSGKVTHIGASSMWTRQFAKALHTSDRMGYDRFATMQNHYNLVYREEEREMLPLCEREDIAVIPWSPLARGYLARPHEEAGDTARGKDDDYFDRRVQIYNQGAGEEINERVQELAQEKGVKMAQISLAWLLHKDWVDAPIIGATKTEYIDDAVEALEIEFSQSELEYLEDPYEPIPIVGHE